MERRRILLGAAAALALSPDVNRGRVAHAAAPAAISKVDPAICCHSAILKINDTTVQCVACDLVYAYEARAGLTISFDGHPPGSALLMSVRPKEA